MRTSLRLFTFVWFAFLLTVSVQAQNSPSAPSFPPKEWKVWVRINLSKDLLLQFLEAKPGKDDYFFVDGIDFWLNGDGGLEAPRKHPVLTGKLPSNNFADRESVIGSGAINHVPLKDQQAIYEHALETVRSFRFIEEFTPEQYDAPGIDLDLHLEINGRSLSVNYRKIQVKDGLPKPILDILSRLRRGLPADYDRLFKLLRVPKPAALPADEADKFSKCSVHKEWMKIAEVPISYGFPSPRPKYWEAAKLQFPNARFSIHAGCVVTPGSPKSGQVLYCISCRAAEETWVKQNK